MASGEDAIPLRVITIDQKLEGCPPDRSCTHTEAVGIELSETQLRSRPGGYSIKLYAKSGAGLIVRLSGAQIIAQLRIVDSVRAALLTTDARATFATLRARDVGMATFTESQVDAPARLIGKAPLLGLPASLRRTGASTNALMQFVVGTDGRVDDATIETVRAPHDSLARAAAIALRQLRFAPAMYRGVRVRQLSRMLMVFRDSL
jgi:TonB family protein